MIGRGVKFGIEHTYLQLRRSREEVVESGQMVSFLFFVFGNAYYVIK